MRQQKLSATGPAVIPERHLFLWPLLRHLCADLHTISAPVKICHIFVFGRFSGNNRVKGQNKKAAKKRRVPLREGVFLLPAGGPGDGSLPGSGTGLRYASRLRASREYTARLVTARGQGDTSLFAVAHAQSIDGYYPLAGLRGGSLSSGYRGEASCSRVAGGKIPRRVEGGRPRPIKWRMRHLVLGITWRRAPGDGSKAALFYFIFLFTFYSFSHERR